jgi:proteasome lid subunit RPN8/RPN11
VELRADEPARHTIVLAGRTAGVIADHIRAVSPYETGGLLFSNYRVVGHKDTHVVYVAGPGLGSRHGRDAVSIGTESAIRAELPDWLDGDSLVTCGDWHSHPPGGDGLLSQADLDCWARRLWEGRRACLFETLGIIVTASDGAGPAVSGWLTRRRAGTDNQFVTVPAKVEDTWEFLA